MNLFHLTGKVAPVTGGNGGIGLGLARGLAQAGAAVAIAARNRAKADAAVAELQKLGAKATFIELDVLDEASCRGATAKAVSAFGRLDILVNNSGTTVRKPPEALTAEEWRLVIETNLTGAFFCSQAAYPEMVRAGGGKIIHIGSMTSPFPPPYPPPFPAPTR